MAREAKKKTKKKSRLDSSDITIDRDSGGDLDPVNKPDSAEKTEVKAPATTSADGGADPAFVYFKDLGRFKILSREKEVEVAQRIEGHKRGIKKIVFSSIVVLDDLISCVDKLEEKEMRLEDIVSPETCRWFAPENIKREKQKVLSRLSKIGSLLNSSRCDNLDLPLEKSDKLLQKRLKNRSKLFIEIEKFNFNLGFLNELVLTFKRQVNSHRQFHRPLNEVAKKMGGDLSEYLFAEEMPQSDLDKIKKRLDYLEAELEKSKQIMIEANMRW